MLTKNSIGILVAAAVTAPALAQQDAVSITGKGETCQIKLLTGPGHEIWAAVDCMSGLDTRFYYYGVKCRGRGPSTLYVSNASTPGPIETHAWQRDGDNVYDNIARKICDMREEKR
jgi:hypothetical protein